MKWLLFFAAAHGVSFSSDQCRVLRQVNIAPDVCLSHFASARVAAASLSGKAESVSAPISGSVSAPGISAPGRTPGSKPGGPSAGKPGNGSPSSPSSPGGPTHGGPGSPGGGDARPGQPAPPLPTPPQKPEVDPAVVAAAIKGLQERARQAVIDRIVFGAKPPDSSRPDFGKPGRPDPGKPGFNPGPGGLRGEAQPKNSGSGGNGNGGSRR